MGKGGRGRRKEGRLYYGEGKWEERGKVKQGEGKSNEGREGKYLVWRISCNVVTLRKGTTVKKEREGGNEDGKKLMINIGRGERRYGSEKIYYKEEKRRKEIKENRNNGK